MGRLAAGVYSSQAATNKYRWAAILTALSSLQIIACPGTKQSQHPLQPDTEPTFCEQLKNSHLLHWKHGQEPYSNSSTGITLAIRRDFAPKRAIVPFSPPTEVQVNWTQAWIDELPKKTSLWIFADVFAQDEKLLQAAMENWMVLPVVDEDEVDPDAAASSVAVSLTGEKKRKADPPKGKGKINTWQRKVDKALVNLDNRVRIQEDINEETVECDKVSELIPVLKVGKNFQKISSKNLRRVANELGERMINEELQETTDEVDRDGVGTGLGCFWTSFVL